MPEDPSTDNSVTRREAIADKFKSWALPVVAAVLAAGFGVASISNGLADRNRATPDQSQAAEQGIPRNVLRKMGVCLGGDWSQ